MPRKSDREKIEKLSGFVKDDIRWRSRHASHDEWDKWEEYYRGEFADGLIPINIYFPTVQSMLPQIYYQNPGVTMSSTELGGDNKARVASAVISWLMREVGLKDEIRACGQNTFFCGTGFLIHGFDSEFGVRLGEGRGPEEDKIEYNRYVKSGMPWTLNSHPEDVLLPWGCTSEKDIRRITFRRMRLVEDVKEDPRYRNTKEVKPSGIRGWGSNSEMLNLHEDWVFLYEMHDMKDGKVKVWAQGCDKFLRYEDSELVRVFDGPPVTVVRWNRNSKSLWGVPDAKMIEDHQKNINDLNTKITKRIRQDLWRFFYDADGLDPNDLDKMTKEESGTGIPTDGSPRDVVFPLDGIGQNPVLWNELQQIERIGRRVIGVPETRMGSYTPRTKRTTGKEVMMAESGGDIRLFPKRDAMAEAIKDTAQKWMDLIGEYWDQKMVIKVPDVDAPVQWVAFRGTDLQGKYEMEVNPEELSSPSSEGRKREVAEIAPFLVEASQLPEVNGGEVVREALKAFPYWNGNRIVAPSARGVEGKEAIAELQPDGTLELRKERGNVQHPNPRRQVSPGGREPRQPTRGSQGQEAPREALQREGIEV